MALVVLLLYHRVLSANPNWGLFLELPGKKEEIILEWTPKGHNETVDKFLKTLPPELLPVRGSAAAQERKQLLQKQIPIHDIDPTLCHDLTEPELLQMNEYIAHVKQSSVGIGHVVQLGLNHGSKHVIGATDPQILASRYPAQLSNAQVVQLHAANNAGKLGEKLQNLNLEERKALNVPEDKQLGVKPGQIVDYNYPVYERVKSPDMYLNYERERAHSPNYAQSLRTNSPDLAQLPHYAPGTINRYNETKTPQKIANVRDLAFSTYDPQTIQNDYLPPNRNLPENTGDVTYPTDVNLPNAQNYVHGDVTYPTDVKLPNAQSYVHGDVTYPTDVKLPNAQSYVHGDVAYPTDMKLPNANYANQLSNPQNYTHGDVQRYRNANSPHYQPNQLNITHDTQSSIDITYPTSHLQQRNDANAQYHTGDVTRPTSGNANTPHYQPNQLHVTHDSQNPVLPHVGDITYPTSHLKRDANTPHYQPNQLTIPHDTQNPTHVPIGAITDITYPTTDVKLAEHRHNSVNSPHHHHQPTHTKNPGAVLTCHRCKKPFKDDEIVIGIERSAALFHASCFKCNGCNQNLADMVYFYDKESDDVYCGRDYAKIRGIPRCKACDELIFVKEYCLAENCTFHVKHFCCFECDTPLAGQNYLMEDAQPVCLPCYERIKANKCTSCFNVIKPDERGVKLHDLHFHANDECFACKVCRKSLLGGKLLLRNQRLYCSAVCYGADQ